MRAWLLTFLVCVSFVSGAGAEDFDLFVMAGQSNMFGYRGDASFYPADRQNLDAEIGFYWVEPASSANPANSSHGAWTHLGPQLGFLPHGHFGPEVTFARTLAGGGRHILIFKYSSGSTSLARDWLAPGEHGMYDGMVEELAKALAQQKSMGNAVTLRALVWIQGESDAETDEMAAKYGPRLRALLADFRRNAAKNPKLPIILGVDELHQWVRARPVVAAVQRQLAEEDACDAATSMIGLQKADNTHLTPKALEAHGLILAAAFRKLEQTCK